jgi:hypothetical protein
MRNRKFLFIATLLVVIASQAEAQDPNVIKPTFSIESRITNLLQGGYEIGLFFNSSSKFSFGAQLAAQNINGGAKELLFNSSNHDNLEIRLPWLVAVKARYHLKKHKEGVYFELSTGFEQFSISSGAETQSNNNGFILPSIGYLWHPWRREGFYVNPNVGYIYAFGRASERTINGVTYELRPLFPSPSLSLGWKFK